ncbi:hypothetical protein B0H11DRAFT_1917721 [Mycena galericulata]|nr:hypothetical protein B0H11DRAFT_1917721 [Mycena galericulata]
MPPTRLFKTERDYIRHLSRLEDYRKYRRTHLEQCRAKGRERMARLRATRTEEQRIKNCEAQARYRERFREEIAHRARRTAQKKKLAVGKETKPRPKARHYYSADELDSDESGEEDDWSRRIPHTMFPTPDSPAVRRALAPDIRPPPALAVLRAPVWRVVAVFFLRAFGEKCNAIPRGIRVGPGAEPPRSVDIAPPRCCRSCSRGCLPRCDHATLDDPVLVALAVVHCCEHRTDCGETSHASPGQASQSDKFVVGVASAAATLIPMSERKNTQQRHAHGADWLGEIGEGNRVSPKRILANSMRGETSCGALTWFIDHLIILVPTNLAPEELVMDQRGKRDARYYCLPPFRGDRSHPRERHGGGFPLHLVAQGHVVGTFDSWVQAKASITGFPDYSHQGCSSEEEAIDVWQRLCVLGIHPHPVDPAFAISPSASAARFVDTSPRKRPAKSTSASAHKSFKQEGAGDSPAAAANLKLLADLKRFASPIRPTTPSPTKVGRPPPGSASDEAVHVNFAIRGAGIISSSAQRSEARYREMQLRGEEPDMLVTRSFQDASFFALEEETGRDGEDADI